MAPEDQPSMQEIDGEDEVSTDEDDGMLPSGPHLQRRPNNGAWRRWFSDFLRSRHTKAAITTAMTLVVVAASWRRYKRYQQQQRQQPSYRSASVVPLSLLLALIDEGRLRKALLGQSRIFFQTVQVLSSSNESLHQQRRWSRVDLPSNTLLQKQLFARLAELKSVELATLPESDYTQWLSGVLAVLPFAYLALVYRMMRNQLGDKDRHQNAFEHRRDDANKTTFRDVAGIDPVISEVEEIVHYLRNPERYQRIGAAAPNGALLHGPPGTGKTLLAQAVAGEASVDCFLACNASDFVELYVGRGAARIRSLFQEVRAEALQRYHRRTTGWWPSMFGSSSHCSSAAPCSAILFIDELDALAKTRSSIGSNDEREQTLNQLLTEMDGFQKDNVVVIVMAATNRVDVLDPAILRRFDRHIHVGYPDAAGREAILRVHGKRVALHGPIDWTAIAETTAGCSGADLRNVVNEAALLAVKGRSNVTQTHLKQGARKMQSMKASLRS